MNINDYTLDNVLSKLNRKVINKMELPDTIQLEVTEEDRQKAGPFISHHQCLIGTAFARTIGVDPVAVFCSVAYCGVRTKDGGRTYYQFDRRMGCHDVFENKDYKRPYYKPEVVGLKLTLTKEHKRPDCLDLNSWI